MQERGGLSLALRRVWRELPHAGQFPDGCGPVPWTTCCLHAADRQRRGRRADGCGLWVRLRASAGSGSFRGAAPMEELQAAGKEAVKELRAEGKADPGSADCLVEGVVLGRWPNTLETVGRSAPGAGRDRATAPGGAGGQRRRNLPGQGALTFDQRSAGTDHEDGRRPIPIAVRRADPDSSNAQPHNRCLGHRPEFRPQSARAGIDEIAPPS